MHFGVPIGAWKLGEAGDNPIVDDEDDNDEGISSLPLLLTNGGPNSGIDDSGMYSGKGVPGALSLLDDIFNKLLFLNRCGFRRWYLCLFHVSTFVSSSLRSLWCIRYGIVPYR